MNKNREQSRGLSSRSHKSGEVGVLDLKFDKNLRALEKTEGKGTVMKNR